MFSSPVVHGEGCDLTGDGCVNGVGAHGAVIYGTWSGQNRRGGDRRGGGKCTLDCFGEVGDKKTSGGNYGDFVFWDKGFVKYSGRGADKQNRDSVDTRLEGTRFGCRGGVGCSGVGGLSLSGGGGPGESLSGEGVNWKDGTGVCNTAVSEPKVGVPEAEV